MADEHLIIKLSEPPPPPEPFTKQAKKFLKENWIALFAAIVSVGSASFSGLQWFDNRQAIKIAQGPYIEITKVALEGDENMKLTIRNIGKTPAMNPQTKSGVFVASDPIGGNFTKLDGWFGSTVQMFLPSIPTGTTTEFYDHFPSVATFKELLKRPSHRIIELRGAILYQDTYRNEFETPYCYQLRVTDEGLSDVSTCFSEGLAKVLRGVYK